MNIKVLEAEHLRDRVLKIKFNDQKEYVVDLTSIINDDPIQLIHALRNKKLFHDFKIAHDTICWSNGADLAPEYLYFLANKENPKLRKKFETWGYI